MSDDREWIRARNAFHLLCKCGSISSANSRIIEPLRRGRIAARALDGTLEHRPPSYRREDVRDWDVPAKIWSNSFNKSHINLSDGTYSTSDASSGYARVELSGLTFDLAQFLEYFDVNPPRPADPAPVADGGGRPVEKELWGNLMAALAVYAQSTGGIEPGEKAGTLYKKVTDFGTSLGLDKFISLDSCRPYLYRTMNLAEKAENSTIGDK